MSAEVILQHLGMKMFFDFADEIGSQFGYFLDLKDISGRRQYRQEQATGDQTDIQASPKILRSFSEKLLSNSMGMIFPQRRL